MRRGVDRDWWSLACTQAVVFGEVVLAVSRVSGGRWNLAASRPGDFALATCKARSSDTRPGPFIRELDHPDQSRLDVHVATE